MLMFIKWGLFCIIMYNGENIDPLVTFSDNDIRLLYIEEMHYLIVIRLLLK